MCVIVNPAAGRGRARRRLEKLRRAWGNRAEFRPTQAPGHAEALAHQAAQEGFRIVAAAGGDGTVHEVANGLLRDGPSTSVDFAVIPIGSANDYADSLEHAFSECRRKDERGRGDERTLASNSSTLPPSSFASTRSVDVGRVRSASGKERYFVCCLGLGLNGAVTLESRGIRRLQGLALYGLATLRALWYHYACPELELAFDGQPAVPSPTLMLSVLAGRREGGFLLAPDARLDDGWLDYVHTGELSRWEVLRLLPRLALSGPPRNHPKVRLGRCRHVRVRAQVPLTVHIDGEFFCTPTDNVRDLDIEIIPAGLRVLTRFLA
jgi:diacylglycerol kinase family enzyme